MNNLLKWNLAACFLLSTSFAFAATGPSDFQYTDVKDFIHQIAAQHPDTTKLISLGPSDSGDTIEGLQIGNGPVHNLVVSTHHGNEYGATEVAKGFAADTAANPIPGQTVFVIPVLNIDGYNARNRMEPLNGQELDPNRNYPGPCGTEGPFTLKSTTALAQFVAANDIVASATLHTYGPLVLYPWGISTSGTDLMTPYDDLFKTLAGYAVIDSHYEIGNSTAALYAADGTYEDYAFWKHGMWSLLFELGDTHTPTDTAVADMVRVNVPGLRNFLAQAPSKRADDHEFHGKCDHGRALLDRHDE